MLETEPARPQPSVVEDYRAATPAPGRRDDVIELVGLDAIHAELDTWRRRTRTELLAVCPARQLGYEDLRHSQDHAAEVLARGVKLRAVVDQECLRDAEAIARHRAITRRGARLRYAHHPPVWMVVFDGVAGIIRSHSAQTGHQAILLRGPAVVPMMVLNFDLIWSRSHPPVARQGNSASGPSELDRLLLRLLSQGVKDEAAARQLGVSVRTVRRQIADLMTRLEAGSRFEAGMQATRRGWLQP